MNKTKLLTILEDLAKYFLIATIFVALLGIIPCGIYLFCFITQTDITYITVVSIAFAVFMTMLNYINRKEDK